MYWDYSKLDSVKVSYIRHSNHNKKGVLVSGIDHRDKVCVGWSLCNESEGDVFDKHRGFDIAEARALNNDRLNKYIPLEDEDEKIFDLIDDIIPQSIHSDLGRFVDRAKLYYKNNVFTDAVEYMHVRL